MRVAFVTLFPEMVRQALGHSIMARAEAAGHVRFETANPRDFTTDKHRTVDDSSYGGGPGMVMKPQPVADALASLCPAPGAAVVLTDPAGELFTQSHAEALSRCQEVVLICGHYEGVDERVRDKLATHCLTIGDFVLTGGELPALVIADAVVRLREGVLGDPESHRDDSHSSGGLLGFPLYTKPATWEGLDVPPVLTSGDHGAVARWRRREQLRRTREHRPDLFAKADLHPGDIDLL
ncbi:MAG: tRNA (guanosine(37)-N1)-methyltransferase TrmD [Fimbriimonadaceae bacterium]|nr:tRNA (guanosine(37)-N1)-methyltransferase TrmD [Fimbriimonadaceae bacterium]